MPFPAAREGRWLARVLLSQNVCLVFLFPSQPPSTHPSRGAIWSHCLLNPGHAKIHFCFFGKHYSSQAEMPGVWIFGLSMILVPWTLPITQIFLPGLGSVFSAFPWFLKLCAPCASSATAPLLWICPWLLCWYLDISFQFSSAHLCGAQEFSQLRVTSLSQVPW